MCGQRDSHHVGPTMGAHFVFTFLFTMRIGFQEHAHPTILQSLICINYPIHPSNQTTHREPPNYTNRIFLHPSK